MAKIKKLPPQKAKDPKKTFKRLFKEVFGGNKLKLTFVIISIIISALSTVYISTLLKTLIDDLITTFKGYGWLGCNNGSWCCCFLPSG